MRKLIFIICLLAAWPCWAANETINDQTALGAKPATDDKLILWDTSTGTTKKVDYSYLNDLKNVDDYGGIQAAVSSFGATATSLIINSAQTVTDNLTVPSTMQLVGLRNGSVSVNAGKTLTISGPLILPDGYQFFSGSGTTTINSSGIVQGAWTGGSGLSGLVKDEDNMASNSASHLATQQSIKAYVDASGGGAKALLKCNSAESIEYSSNVASISDVGPGQVTVTWETDFSDANYVVVASVTNSSDKRWLQFANQLAGSILISSYSSASGGLADPISYHVAAFGAQ